MKASVRGKYRDGRVELTEPVTDVPDGTPVVVTFGDPRAIDLRDHGIDRETAAELRARLAAFAEDWESPEMAIYDDYDAARSRS